MRLRSMRLLGAIRLPSAAARQTARATVSLVFFLAAAAAAQPSPETQALQTYLSAVQQPEPQSRIAAMQQFLAAAPTSSLRRDAVAILAWDHLRSGQRVHAHRWASELLALEPENPFALSITSDVEAVPKHSVPEISRRNLLKQIHRALEDWEKLRKPEGMSDGEFRQLSADGQARLNALAGRDYLNRRRYVTARAYLDRAVALRPNDPQYVYSAALAHLDGRRADLTRGYWLMARAVNLAGNSPSGQEIAEYARARYLEDGGTSADWDAFLQAAATAAPAEAADANTTNANTASTVSTPSSAPATDTVTETTAPTSQPPAATAGSPATPVTQDAAPTASGAPPSAEIGSPASATTTGATGASTTPETEAPAAASATTTTTTPDGGTVSTTITARPSVPSTTAPTTTAPATSTDASPNSAPSGSPSSSGNAPSATAPPPTGTPQPTSDSPTAETPATDAPLETGVSRPPATDTTGTSEPTPPPLAGPTDPSPDWPGGGTRTGDLPDSDDEEEAEEIDPDKLKPPPPPLIASNAPPIRPAARPRAPLGSPVSLGIVVQSAINARNREPVVFAISDMVRRLREQDEAFMLSFNKGLVFEQDLTDDHRLLEKALENIRPEEGTAMVEAMGFAAGHLARIGKNPNRVLLVVVTGEGAEPRPANPLGELEASSRALSSGARIYCIAVGVSGADARQRLETLTTSTGGEVQYIADMSQFRTAAWNIADRLGLRFNY